MKRGVVHREVVVVLNLAPGEVEDMTKRFGSTVFAPSTLTLAFSSRGSDWVIQEIAARGPRRLKSGALSTSGELFNYDWRGSDLKSLPRWVVSAIESNTPSPVAADDLPVLPDATDLDGDA